VKPRACSTVTVEAPNVVVRKVIKVVPINIVELGDYRAGLKVIEVAFEVLKVGLPIQTGGDLPAERTRCPPKELFELL
jgi:hypothetical protein